MLTPSRACGSTLLDDPWPKPGGLCA